MARMLYGEGNMVNIEHRRAVNRTPYRQAPSVLPTPVAVYIEHLTGET